MKKQQQATGVSNRCDPSAEVLLIGVGNEFRRDDSVGIQIVRQLSRLHLGQMNIREESGEGASLIDAWSSARRVFLFDAVSTGSFPPGKIYRIDVHQQELISGFFHYSSHKFGVAEAIELARRLHRLPPEMIIFGIEGGNFTHGTGLTPPVAAAVPEVIAQMMLEFRNVSGNPGIAQNSGEISKKIHFSGAG